MKIFGIKFKTRKELKEKIETLEAEDECEETI